MGDDMTRTTQEQETRSHSFFHHALVRRTLSFVLIAIVTLIFIFENTAETTVRLLVPVVTMPLWGALLIAWVLGLLASFFGFRRRQR